MHLLKTIAESSHNFAAPFSTHETSKVDQILFDAPISALNIMASTKSHSKAINDIRVYTAGTRSPELEYKVLSTPPDSFENLEKWSLNFNSEVEFQVVLNSVERWVEPIARWTANFFKEVSPIIDNRLLHLEVTYFIGNHRFTPFGVHIDKISEALHFNLGPTDRKMYLWEIDQYLKYNSSLKPMFEPELILSVAKEHEIKNGSWFFLPASSFYHIGHNTGFNVSLAIALIRFDEEKILDRALHIKTESLSKDLNIVQMVTDEIIDGLNGGQGIKLSSNYDAENLNISEAVSEYVLRIRSNCGLINPPMLNEQLDENWKVKKIRLVEPFRILFVETIDKLKIFVRGSMLTVRKHEGLKSIIEQLNSGEEYNVSHFEQKYGCLISEQAIYSLLMWFLRCQGVEVVN